MLTSRFATLSLAGNLIVAVASPEADVVTLFSTAAVPVDEVTGFLVLVTSVVSLDVSESE